MNMFGSDEGPAPADIRTGDGAACISLAHSSAQYLHSHELIFESTLRIRMATGGLMNYGTNIPDAFHEVGVYTGNIEGQKACLPVWRATDVRFVLNLKTATRSARNHPGLAERDRRAERLLG